MRCSLCLIADRTPLDTGLTFDSLDENDSEAIDVALKGFSPVDFYYSIYSPGDESDATELWNEARALGMEVLKQQHIDPFISNFSALNQIQFPTRYFIEIANSRLGSFINRLKPISTDAIVAITLVDGAIERTKTGSPRECISEILRSLVLPWDCSPNTLYIFGSGISQFRKSMH